MTKLTIRRIVTHCLALAIGGIIGGTIAARAASSSEVVTSLMATLPTSTAAGLAYAWGSEPDAKAMLSAHIQKLAPDDPFQVRDANYWRLRLALLEDQPPSELKRLCESLRVVCPSDKLEAVLKRLRTQRRVDSAR